MLLTLGRGMTPVQRPLDKTSLLLHDNVPSCVFDLDTSLADSYTGSGNLKNLCLTPADGAAQAAYDFPLWGTHTLEGTAGHYATYLRAGGNGGFRLNNTTFTNGLNRTDISGQAYSGVVVFRYTANSAVQGLFGTTGNNVSAGFVFRIQDNGRLFFRQNNGSNGVFSAMGAEHTLTDGKDYILGFSKRSAGDQFCFWIQGVSTAMANESLSCSINSESATLGMFASSSGAGWPIAEHTRIYAASFFNSFLSQGDMNKIMTVYRKRHKRDYAA